jgi:hypothetical protein
LALVERSGEADDAALAFLTLDLLSLEGFCFALEGIAVITVLYLREAR